jgi:hypothetical protein
MTSKAARPLPARSITCCGSDDGEKRVEHVGIIIHDEDACHVISPAKPWQP